MSRGFTLIELMVTLAIAAILASLAAPSFTRMIEDNRITTQANDLLTGMTLARSEAVKRGVTITITPEANNYLNGWCVHASGAAATCSTAGTLIRSHEALAQAAGGGLGTHNDTAISFDSFGVNIAAANRVITLRPSSCSTGDNRQRTLTVNAAGHARIEVTTCP